MEITPCLKRLSKNKSFILCLVVFLSLLSYGQKKTGNNSSNSFIEVERGAADLSGSYKILDNSFAGYNIDRYNNRPLYCYHMINAN